MALSIRLPIVGSLQKNLARKHVEESTSVYELFQGEYYIYDYSQYSVV